MYASVLRLAFVTGWLALSVDALVTPPPPQALVSCPGMKRSDASTVTCSGTPVRVQAVVAVAALRSRGITECAAFDYTQDQGHAADCDADGIICYDSRDCCSDYCDFEARGSGDEDGADTR